MWRVKRRTDLCGVCGDPAWGRSTADQMWHLLGGLAQGGVPCANKPGPTSSLTHLLFKHPLVTGTCIP